MKGQGHGRNFLAPFVLDVVVIKRWDGFRLALTRVGLGLDARIKAQPSLLMLELPLYFIIFPPFEKSWFFFCFLFSFALAGGSAVLRVLDSGGFSRELPYRRPFPSLVSLFLPFLFLSFLFFQHFSFSFE